MSDATVLRCTEVRQQEDGRWRAEFNDGHGTQCRMVATIPLALAVQVGAGYRLDLTRVADAPPAAEGHALPLLEVRLSGTVRNPEDM
jgi:hypothetical protein